jgi:hypothetical protein
LRNEDEFLRARTQLRIPSYARGVSALIGPMFWPVT